jgi:hypothetical protein
MKNKLNAELLNYDSFADITLSDHKPVKAEFELSIEDNEDNLIFKINEDDNNSTNNLKRYSSASNESTKLYSCMIF